MIEVGPHARGAILPVRAQPGAKRNAVLGERAGALRVAVTAAPEQGKANAAIAAVLAGALGIRGSQVAILSGATTRDKRFLVIGLSEDEVKAKLDRMPSVSIREPPPALVRGAIRISLPREGSK